MNKRANVNKLPLILPLYYYEPANDKVYNYKNEYYFGEDLIVCPVTRKIDAESGLAKTRIWLPEGEWFDIFTGVRYRGNRELEIYRNLEDIAVFAREGSILPLDANVSTNEISSPAEMDLFIFAGKDGEFTLAEDEKEFNTYVESDWAYTGYEILEGNAKRIFRINPVSGNKNAAREKRRYNLYFYGAGKESEFDILLDKKKIEPVSIEYDETKNVLIIRLPEISSSSALEVEIDDKESPSHSSIQSRVFDILNKAQIEYDLKTKVMEVVRKYNSQNACELIGEIYSVCENEFVRGAIIELLSAK